MAPVAVAAIVLLFTLPPNPEVLSLEGLDPAILGRTVSGAYHIHTTRSDGAEEKDAVAAAAARAGLQFAIFTDHGDGTRSPDPPAYAHGVLCLDAVEISTNGGHYVAIGMPAAPYPLGGDSEAVVEDVRRLGGFGIAAHPDHPKEQLAWSRRDLPVDGIEWINADSEWRNEPAVRLARVLFDYLFRPAPALASVFDRPEQTLAWWDSMLASRPVVALAAVDAHGSRGGDEREEGGARFGVGPSYEASFRTLTNRVILEAPLSGDARADADALLAAIRRGHVYSVVSAISPSLVVNVSGEDASVRVSSPLPAGASVEIRGSHAGRRWTEVTHPGAPGSPRVPWGLVNPPMQPFSIAASPLPPNGEGEALRLVSSWRVEKDPRSTGEIDAGADALSLRYALAPGERSSQFVAAAADVDATQQFDTITFTARADRPTRVSVQVRVRPDDARWTRSVYLDATERQVAVKVSEMTPAERSVGRMQGPVSPRSLMFVVDLTNARAGDAGSFTISGIRVSAQSPAAPR